ncbi:helicase-related protein [Bifidobacterium platyrrhinorum]|uniref:RNA helicase n=1 Tax=Bifidobacterium platyrrhinorum TaxID=2661628 RepID=A0A6L9SPM5_9BIFI|nr:helicase-related protein [Bifidobacterium platyrrhinorum]NEG54488.1 hypothetical protein [Bifidobacterium platyrrhinorum]
MDGERSGGSGQRKSRNRFAGERERNIRRFRMEEERRRKAGRRRAQKRAATEGVREYVLANTPKSIGMAMPRRRFVLHVGPTNSGKTHDALETLKKARTGVYLAPLRLLALEVGERLRDAGIRSSIVTGEEQDMADSDTHFSGTVEMLDTHREYEVAVIDEAQMIADSDRGGAWTRAILQVRAEEVHVCMSPEALGLVFRLLDLTPNEAEVVQHERANELVVEDDVWDGDLQTGDAYICFSRRQVLEVAGRFERDGHHPAVIYGGLPWRARRREAAKFLEGSADVLVATDAIGMGLNLPIRRIIFHQLHKYDGRSDRPLTDLEIRQIAGRAGRYGMFEEGRVTAVRHKDMLRLRDLLAPFPVEPIDYAYRSFDLALGLDERWPLSLIMRCWRETRPGASFLLTQDVSTPIEAAIWVERKYGNAGMERDMAYDLAFLPFEWDDHDLRDEFRSSVRRFMRGDEMTWLAMFDADGNDLKELERGLKILAFRFAFARAVGLLDDDMLTGFNATRDHLERMLINLLDGPKGILIR